MTISKPAYATVILPLATPTLYSYEIPASLISQLTVGMRVIVPFGAKKMYAGIVYSIFSEKPDFSTIKKIDSCVDDQVLVSDKQLKFWTWLSDYYMCTLGEVMKTALPSGLKLESETILYLGPAFVSYDGTNTDAEILLRFLELNNSISLQKAAKLLNRKNVFSVVNPLIQKGILSTGEHIRSQFSPKTETVISFAGNCNSAEWVELSLQKITSAPKQQQAFSFMLNAYEQHGLEKDFSILKKQFIQEAGVSSAIVSQLIQKQIFCESSVEVSRLTTSQEETFAAHSLSKEQENALDSIIESFKTKQVCLLHGITASGKTEIYISFIRSLLNEGKQVLYLVPEIALTPQITHKLTRVFGKQVRVYHSRMSDNERVEVWNELQNPSKHSLKIILGVRSSLFLPFNNLGAVIIDEEHDSSFKQIDPAPRYHARDSAIMLAKMHNAPVLLGSATPSVESYYNVLAKKYAYVNLSVRFGSFIPPEIKVIDLSKAYKRKQMHQHFSKELLTHVYQTLKDNRKVLLLQNRRGYSPFIECTACGHVPYCKHCDVSLTFHRSSQLLVCHYCGYSIALGTSCFSCGSKHVQAKGFGTEKIEEEIKSFFPNHVVARMDADTTRGRHGFSRIISQMENKKIDILVGTQMITKGLDFSDVGLVGIVQADNLLSVPDYRAYEYAFQRMVQVAGRAGRGDFSGIVCVQTFSPEHPIIQFVKNDSYLDFVHNQLHERKEFHYPPFVRLLRISLKHNNEECARGAADFLKQVLPPQNFVAILGPEPPLIQKVQKRFVMQLLLKVSRKMSFEDTRKRIQKAIHTVKDHPDFKSVYIYTEVDV